MQNQSSKEGSLRLCVILPGEAIEDLPCDSVHLTLADDSRGKGGGSIGIRHGHAKAILALAPGSLTALLDGQIVLERRCSAGFARIENDRITVVIEATK